MCRFLRFARHDPQSGFEVQKSGWLIVLWIVGYEPNVKERLIVQRRLQNMMDHFMDLQINMDSRNSFAIYWSSHHAHFFMFGRFSDVCLRDRETHHCSNCSKGDGHSFNQF